MKNPNPMSVAPIQGAIHGMFRLDVHPKIKRPPAKKTDPTIMGGSRASGTALFPLATY